VMSPDEVPTALPAAIAKSKKHATLETTALWRPPPTLRFRAAGAAINDSDGGGRRRRPS
jgi:hypothetical protein